MKERLLTALPLIFIVSLAFALPGVYGASFFVLMALAMVCAGFYEAFAMCNLADGRSFALTGTIFAVLLTLSSVFMNVFSPGGAVFTGADVFVICLYMLFAIWPVFRKGPSAELVNAYFISLGIFMYLGVMLSFFAKLYFLQIPCGQGIVSGRSMLLFIIAVTKMADVGAYFIGASTARLPGGNHKLAPVVSPKKSIEGLIGGTVFSTGTAIGLSYIPGFIRTAETTLFSMWELVAIGVGASVIGLLGDLIESALKRASGKKDSGSIPGIGGILDVLDSLIPISPLFYAYIFTVCFR